MQTSGLKGNLFEVLAEQMKVHLDVVATAEEIKEEIMQELSDDHANINEILTAAANIFFTDIIIFKGTDNNYERITARKSVEGPLYLLQHTLDIFESVTFKKENIAQFNCRPVQLGQRKLTTTYDNLGRAHLPTPRTGPALLYLRSCKYNHSTISTHVKDLCQILKTRIETTGQNSYMFISDGGPDFNPSSVLNQLFLYRLFKKLDLDLLAVFTYAARYSAFNPIEHLWSPLSKQLSGVIFDPVVPGENKSPINQSNLTKEQLVQKESIVFNKAMRELKAFWNGSKFDDHLINIEIVETNSDMLLFDDYEKVQKFLASPLRDVHNFINLLKEYKSLFMHIDRHANEVIFTKCEVRSCCQEWRSTSLQEFLLNFKMLLFAPSITTTHVATMTRFYSHV